MTLTLHREPRDALPQRGRFLAVDLSTSPAKDLSLPCCSDTFRYPKGISSFLNFGQPKMLVLSLGILLCKLPFVL